MLPAVAVYLIALMLTASRTPTRWLPATLLLAAVALLALVRPDVVSGPGQDGAPRTRKEPGGAGGGTSAPSPMDATGRVASSSREQAVPIAAPGGASPVSAVVAGIVAFGVVTGIGLGGAVLL